MSSKEYEPELSDFMRAELVRFSDEAEVLKGLQDQVDVIEDDDAKAVVLGKINDQLANKGVASSLAEDFCIVSIAGVDTVLSVVSKLIEEYVAKSGNDAFRIETSLAHMDVGGDCPDIHVLYLVPKDDMTEFGQFVSGQYLRRGKDIYGLEIYEIDVPDINERGWMPGAYNLKIHVVAPGGVNQQLVPTFDGRSIKLIRTRQDGNRAKAINLIGGKNIDKAI